jgi:hypothetical protein
MAQAQFPNHAQKRQRPAGQHQSAPGSFGRVRRDVFFHAPQKSAQIFRIFLLVALRFDFIRQSRKGVRRERLSMSEKQLQLPFFRVLTHIPDKGSKAYAACQQQSGLVRLKPETRAQGPHHPHFFAWSKPREAACAAPRHLKKKTPPPA